MLCLMPRPMIFTSLCVVGDECQEVVNHGYRRNVKEHVGGDVTLGKKLAKLFVVVFFGVPDFHVPAWC